jgi:hypothetical protein
MNCKFDKIPDNQCVLGGFLFSDRSGFPQSDAGVSLSLAKLDVYLPYLAKFCETSAGLCGIVRNLS